MRNSSVPNTHSICTATPQLRPPLNNSNISKCTECVQQFFHKNLYYFNNQSHTQDDINYKHLCTADLESCGRVGLHDMSKVEDELVKGIPYFSSLYHEGLRGRGILTSGRGTRPRVFLFLYT